MRTGEIAIDALRSPYKTAIDFSLERLMMIRPEKQEHALKALNSVLVWARKMAYEKASHDDIADVLDTAELLPMLILRTDDTTQFYRDLLVALAAKHTGFGIAVADFDGDA